MHAPYLQHQHLFVTDRHPVGLEHKRGSAANQHIQLVGPPSKLQGHSMHDTEVVQYPYKKHGIQSRLQVAGAHSTGVFEVASASC